MHHHDFIGVLALRAEREERRRREASFEKIEAFVQKYENILNQAYCDSKPAELQQYFNEMYATLQASEVITAQQKELLSARLTVLFQQLRQIKVAKKDKLSGNKWSKKVGTTINFFMDKLLKKPQQEIEMQLMMDRPNLLDLPMEALWSIAHYLNVSAFVSLSLTSRELNDIFTEITIPVPYISLSPEFFVRTRHYPHGLTLKDINQAIIATSINGLFSKSTSDKLEEIVARREEKKEQTSNISTLGC